MTLEGKTIGVALTGSFCTYSKAFPQIEVLVKEGAAVQTIFSNDTMLLQFLIVLPLHNLHRPVQMQDQK